MALEESTAKQAQKSFRLDYSENERGVSKRVELKALSLHEVVDLALADPARRDISIFEGEHLACRVTRGQLLFARG